MIELFCWIAVATGSVLVLGYIATKAYFSDKQTGSSDSYREALFNPELEVDQVPRLRKQIEEETAAEFRENVKKWTKFLIEGRH